MIKMNNKMKYIFFEHLDDLNDEIIHQLDEIVSNIKMVNSCIIYDKDGINDSDIDMDRILKFTKTLTAYEIGCNEFIIKNVHSISLKKIASYLLDSMKRKFEGSEFVIYLIMKEDSAEIKFHKYRKDDGLWISDEINDYDEPILCMSSSD